MRELFKGDHNVAVAAARKLKQKQIIALSRTLNYDKVSKFSHFVWGYLACNGSWEQKNKMICIPWTLLHPCPIKYLLKETACL